METGVEKEIPISQRMLPVWQAGLIVLLVVLAYLPALQGGFVWAWTTRITNLLRDTSGLCLIWFNPTALQQYYPLSGTSFWLDYHFWKWWTTPYHVENVLLHALAALLFWRLLLRLRVPGAWLASALFALHPVMVQSVAWITERKNVLSMVFYLGALLAYERYAPWVTETGALTPAPNAPRSRWRPSLFYGLAFVLFLGALLAKTSTVALPAVILLIGWWKRGQIRMRGDVLPMLPFFVVTLGLGTLTCWLEKHHLLAEGQDFSLTFLQRCLVAGRAFWFYLGHLFWPVNLCFVYPRWQPNPGSWWQWLYPVTALGALLLLWLARGRIGRGPVTALFYFVGTLLPLLGFLNGYGMRYSFVWDQWVYLSALGIFALVAALAVRAAIALSKPGLVYGFAAIVLPTLALLTWQQAGKYIDTETLWRDTLARNPECWMAHYNLGIILEQDSRLDEAVTQFQETIRLKPDHTNARIHLGFVLWNEGQINEAISQFQEAIRLKPDSSDAHNDLAIALMSKKQFDEAISQYKEAIRLKPDNAAAYQNLGDALAAKGKLDEAVERYRQAIQINPKVPEFYIHLGVALDQLGRTREAATQYREALRLNPDQVAALINLAWELATSPDDRLRNGTEAVQLAERACVLTDYERPQLIGTLAAAYAEAGRFEDAVATARKAHDLALKLGRQKVALKNQELLQLFENHQPYREKPGQSD